MKANHISAERRLTSRIWKLEARLDNAFKKTRKRFYPYCRHCEKTNVQVSMDGHARYCPVRGLDQEIQYYKKLLEALSKVDPSEEAPEPARLDSE